MRHANPSPRRFVRAFPDLSRASKRIPIPEFRVWHHAGHDGEIPAVDPSPRRTETDARPLTRSPRVPPRATSTIADPNAAVVPAGEPPEAEKPVGATDEASDAAPAETADAAGEAARDGAEASVSPGDAPTPADSSSGAEPVAEIAGEASPPGGNETAASAAANAAGAGAPPSEPARPSSPLPTCTLHEAAELGDVASLEKLLRLDASCDVDARDASEASEVVREMALKDNSRHCGTDASMY